MPSSFTRRFLITYFIFCFLVCVEKGLAAEPTLARLSFWVPEERMAEFEVAYLKKVVPVLKGHEARIENQVRAATFAAQYEDGKVPT